MSAPKWERFSEPWSATARRTGLLALGIGVVIAILRRRALSLLTGTIGALVFTFGGHVAEVFFLNQVRPRISAHRTVQFTTRLAYWYVTGGILFTIGLTARVIPSDERHYVWWPFAGLVFMAVELAIHA